MRSQRTRGFLYELQSRHPGMRNSDAACPQAIDRVLAKVEDLAGVVESMPCDVFDKAKAAEWRCAKAGFDSRHSVVENAIKDLIDTSFRCGIYQSEGLGL